MLVVAIRAVMTKVGVLRPHVARTAHAASMTVAPTIVSPPVNPREMIVDRVRSVRKGSVPMTAVQGENVAPATIVVTADGILASRVAPIGAADLPGLPRRRAGTNVARLNRLPIPRRRSRWTSPSATC